MLPLKTMSNRQLQKKGEEKTNKPQQQHTHTNGGISLNVWSVCFKVYCKLSSNVQTALVAQSSAEGS